MNSNIKFFYDYAGHSHDPKTETTEEGRLRCATELALAERWAKQNGIHHQWWIDADYTVGKDDDLHPEECSSPYLCIAGHMDSPFDPVDPEASLGGILFAKGKDYANDPYGRIVEAELSMEIMMAAGKKK